MIALRRKLLPMLACFASALAAACGDDTTAPPSAVAPTNLTVTSTSATSARISFDGHTGDVSYVVERATGATGGTFASVATPAAPTSGTTVTVDDNGLAANTTYRYRVSAIRGSSTSAPSAEASVITGVSMVTVTQDITANTTWTSDNVYLLKGFIHVTNGATLTIQAGTTIKGDYDTQGSSLFVLRGAKINAVGTAAAPIVFTSSQPVGQRRPGDWGGLIIIGNAVINRTGIDIEVEGTNTATGTASGTNYQVLYSGGNNDADNSGELKYVRVEYAGFAPKADQELNSYTFAAVGSGTKLSYLQALAGLDDSFEFFGGAVDGDHFVSYESGDDHFDMSEGYRGRLQYLIAFQSTQLAPRQGAVGGLSSDPQGIENDGCSGNGCTSGFNSTPLTIPVVANFTLVGTGSTASSGTSGGIGMMLRRGTGGYYVNGIVARYPRAGISLRDADTYARAGGAATQDLATADLAVKNLLFVETSTVFQGTNGTNVQNALDLGGNALVNNTTATTASIFTAFPATVSATTTEAAFDWTPAASSPAASGGLATFTGKLATKTSSASPTGNTVAGTAYVGAAAPGGAKWWAGWTKYAQQ